MTSWKELVDKAAGCLAGVAIGDAMGMPTTFYTPSQIKERFGIVDKFLDAPEDHPFHRGLKAGQVTDDTKIALILAQTIIEVGEVSPEEFLKRLLNWIVAERAAEKGLIGPSTSKALERIISGGRMEEAGKYGTTNGASARIPPVAIFDSSRRRELIKDTVSACIVTHNTNIAISAAMAVSFAIAKGVSGANNLDLIIEEGVRGARIGVKFGTQLPSAPVHKRIRLALKLVSRARSMDQAIKYLYNYVGTGLESNEAIPTAFGIIKYVEGDLLRGISMAANVGGDTDTIAAIVGGILGAFNGLKRFPREMVSFVENVNNLNFIDTAEKLLKVAMKSIM